MTRISTTHTGSLIRPRVLQEAFRELGRLEASARGDLPGAAPAAVADVISRQVATGIDMVSDGEFTKRSWLTYLYDRLDGIEQRQVATDPDSVLRNAGIPVGDGHDKSKYAELWRLADYWSEDWSVRGNGTTWVCVDEIRYDPAAVEAQLGVLSAALAVHPGVTAFVSAMSPSSIYYLRDEHYGTEEGLVFAVADALREEYRAIIGAGYQLQIDDPVMWHMLPTIRLRGGTFTDYERWADLRVAALNHALEGLPEDRIRYHICTGSEHGTHLSDPALADVVAIMLRIKAGMYLFEQANPRHEHEWSLWDGMAIPDGKVLVPGVVTHHTESVEHPELVAQRLVRMARIVGADRLVAGTDCGFAQAATIERVTEAAQWAKLGALVEGARLASERI